MNLETGKIGNGDLAVKSKYIKREKNRSDWRFYLEVQNGGLIERSKAFDFIAPESGYQESVEIGDMASNSSWRSQDMKDYFVSLPENRYARLLIRFYPSDYRNMIVLESYLNPTPGDRNIEYDPAKEIKP